MEEKQDKIDSALIIKKINEFESRIKELEKRTIKIERIKLNLIPKYTLSKEDTFEKSGAFPYLYRGVG